MSKPNKVNKDHYNQAGRLTPDEMGRERSKQAQARSGATAESVRNAAVEGRRRGRAERESSRPRSAPEE